MLVLHSRYLSGAASGENRVVEDEVRLLRDAGHEVATWQPSVEPGTSGLALARDAVWSKSGVRTVARLVHEHEPELVHVHSLYPRLSPAILRGVRRGIPIVATLHNFRLMCLPATYLRDGRVCEDCAGRVPWPGVVHACYRGSRPASAALGVSLALHRQLRTFERVQLFLAVSRFVLEKHVEAGVDRQRLRVKGNFAWPAERREGPGGPLLYLGRLSVEKGVDTVLRALPPGMELLVAGEGPERAQLERLAPEGVTFLGEVEPARVPDLLRRARALVVPSRCYEGQPRAVLEAFAAGVPVVASRIGGLPELVVDGVNGVLVDSDSRSAWGAALEVVADEAFSRRLGDVAYATWTERFTPAVATESLESIYQEALAGRPGT